MQLRNFLVLFLAAVWTILPAGCGSSRHEQYEQLKGSYYHALSGRGSAEPAAIELTEYLLEGRGKGLFEQFDYKFTYASPKAGRSNGYFQQEVLEERPDLYVFELTQTGDEVTLHIVGDREDYTDFLDYMRAEQ